MPVIGRAHKPRIKIGARALRRRNGRPYATLMRRRRARNGGATPAGATPDASKCIGGVMLDIIFLLGGLAVFVAFGLYAVALKRV